MKLIKVKIILMHNNYLLFVINLILSSISKQAYGKIFERCELVRLLINEYQLQIDQVANFVCIAQYQSGFNSSLQGGILDNIGTHGLFQISDQYWCSPPGNGWVCGVTCDQLRDDDITDDLICAQTIYAEHQKISGDGYNAWSTYQPFCKGKAFKMIQDCFDNNHNDDRQHYSGSSNFQSHHKTVDDVHKLKQLQKGKVFERCELANLLRNTHKLSFDEVANLVCIAQYQSGFNSSLITGTVDNQSHGLFQINDVYWCGKSGGCSLPCDKLRDNNLIDDLACVRIIYNEHQKISGDGYNAWTTYQSNCRGTAAYDVIKDCFKDSEFKKPINSVVSTFKSQRPGKSDIFNFNRIYDVQNRKQQQQQQYAKVYSPCELAQELYFKHSIPMDQIATWVCIVKHESNFNTSAVGRLNADGSEDHGLFQISDIYWCSPPGRGWACGLSCSQLEDSDITDDVECMKKIYKEHERISGDGFTAWTVYRPYCQGRSNQYISGCFNEIADNYIGNDEKSSDSSLKIIAKATPFPNVSQLKEKTGKIYTACELAQELKEKHKIPEYQIATWVCIAKYESNFNTSAIGYGDHGLFQISDIYWCSPPGHGWACGLSCSNLEDDDITDDVKCIKKIYEEHTRLSGDGFNAWNVYSRYCSRGRARKYIKDCEEIIYEDLTVTTLPTTTTSTPRPTTTTTKKYYSTVPKPIYTQPPTTPRPPRITTTSKKSYIQPSKTKLLENQTTPRNQINTQHERRIVRFGSIYSTEKPKMQSRSTTSSSLKTTVFERLFANSIKTTTIFPKSSSSISINDRITTQIQSYPESVFKRADTLITTTRLTNAYFANKLNNTTIGNKPKSLTTKKSQQHNNFNYSTLPSTTTTRTRISTKNIPNKKETTVRVTKNPNENIFEFYFKLFNISPSSLYKKPSDNKRDVNFVGSTVALNAITTTSRSIITTTKSNQSNSRTTINQGKYKRT